MSNEEIIKGLKHIVINSLRGDRIVLLAAIARLSAPARTEWVWQRQQRKDAWVDCAVYEHEEFAKRDWEDWGMKDGYRVVERTTVETVKEW